MKPLKNSTETTCRLSHIRRKLRKLIANMQQKKKHILAIKTKILTIKPTVIKVTLEKKKQILAVQNQKLQTVYKTSKTDTNIKKGLLVKHLCRLFWYVRVCICVLKDILPAKKRGPLVHSFFPQS